MKQSTSSKQSELVVEKYSLVSVFRVDGDMNYQLKGSEVFLPFPENNHFRLKVSKKEEIIVNANFGYCQCYILNEGPISVIISFSDGWSARIKAGRHYQFHTRLPRHFLIHL